MSDQTNGMYAETFLKVWDAASSEKEDALAYGFLSHNQQRGADYVAHTSGLGLGYENNGYIIIKTRQLLETPLDLASPRPSAKHMGSERQNKLQLWTNLVS